MSVDAGSLELAHARLWARHGQSADEALWHRIEVTRDLAAVLELARRSPLSRWVQEIDVMRDGADLHALDRRLRQQWRNEVAEVASWMPAPWQRAVHWCAALIDLPTVQHLARGGEVPAWLHADPVLAGLVDGHAAPTPLAALLEAARADPLQVLALWRAEWLRRLPQGAATATLRSRLLPLLEAHRAAFSAPRAQGGWAARQQLQQRLVLLLRRTLLEPANAFIHLALGALEFERLRGELMRRALAGPGPGIAR